MARHYGLRDSDIQSSWSRYAKWTVDKFGEAALLGGEPWGNWAQKDAINLAKNREAEDEAKDRQRRQDEAYRREAVRGSVSAVWDKGHAAVRAAGCTCPRCRTVLVVDGTSGTVVRRREITAEDLIERRCGKLATSAADVVVDELPDDSIYVERRAQSLRDLEAERTTLEPEPEASPLTEGLGL